MHNNDNMPPHRRKKGFLLLFIPIMFLGLGAIVMLLWNALLPQLIGVNPVSYWQAVGLLVLCRILFGGFRFGPRGGGFGHHGRPDFGRHQQMRQKWMNMTDEERADFKEKLKKRCEQYKQFRRGR